MVSIGDAELEVLKVLWAYGPNTVRDISSILESQGRTWAYTTVQTMLHRLRDKGVVVIEKVGNTNRFEATLTRDHVVQEELSDLMERYCEEGAAPLMLALVENHRFTAEEIEMFKGMLDRLEETP